MLTGDVCTQMSRGIVGPDNEMSWSDENQLKTRTKTRQNDVLPSATTLRVVDRQRQMTSCSGTTTGGVLKRHSEKRSVTSETNCNMKCNHTRNVFRCMKIYVLLVGFLISSIFVLRTVIFCRLLEDGALL